MRAVRKMFPGQIVLLLVHPGTQHRQCDRSMLSVHTNTRKDSVRSDLVPLSLSRRQEKVCEHR